MRICRIVALSFCMLNVCSAYDGSAYKLQHVLPYYMQGWFGPANANMLKHFITTMHARCVVELGTWLGESAIHMGQVLSKTGGELYCVDHWKGSVEHQKEKILPKLYEQFLSNVIHKGLTHVIVPVRMDTIQAAAALTIVPQLVYVDASHDATSVFNDICAWYPKLVDGGIMCGDDFSWPSVREGMFKAAALFGKQYHSQGFFWWFDPK